MQQARVVYGTLELLFCCTWKQIQHVFIIMVLKFYGSIVSQIKFICAENGQMLGGTALAWNEVSKYLHHISSYALNRWS